MKRSLSLRALLTAIMLLCMIVPVALLTFFHSRRIQTQLAEQQARTYRAALSQAATYAAEKYRIARNLVNTLCGDSTVQQGASFSQISGSDASSGTAWLADLSSGMISYKGSLLGSLSHVYLYPTDRMSVFRNGSLYGALSEAERDELERWWLDPAQTSRLITFHEDSGRESRYVYLLVKVPSASRLGSYLGMIQADLSMSTFSSIMSDIPATAHTSVLLLDEDGDMFLSSGQRTESGLYARLLAQLPGDEEADTLSVLRDGAETWLVGTCEVNGTGWRLMLLIPYTDITAVTSGSDRLVLTTALVLVLILVPVIALLASQITRPIRDLKDGVDRMARGDHDVRVEPWGPPEVRDVIGSFNTMASETEHMLEEQYRLGETLKAQELQLLQEQIDPHFLYNTLDMLHWEARKAGSDKMEQIVYALS